MKKITCILIIIFVFVCNGLIADERILDGYLDYFNTIQSLEINFTQRNYWPEQDLSNESSGVLYVKDKNILLEHLQPEHQIMLGTDTELIFYFPEKKQMIGGDSSEWQYFISPKFLANEYLNFCTLESTLEEENSFIFSFLPNEKMNDLKEIRITVSKQDSLIKGFFYKDNFDNEVLFTFFAAKINQEIPDSRFRLKIPRDVQVIDNRKKNQK
jgi:outer membrane lipoprotein-sorting protein